MSLNRLAAAAAAAAAFATAASAQHEVPACDRACLEGFADAFFDALLANDAGAARLAAEAKTTLNGDVTPLADAFWEEAESIPYRLEIFDPEHGGIGVQARISGSDGEVVAAVRLEVEDDAISEVEIIAVRDGMANPLWDPSTLTEVSPNFQLSIRPAEQDSYYGLVAAAEAYWRAFQTNGTEDYHPAPFLPDVVRYENGRQTTGTTSLGGPAMTPGEQFDSGRFPGRNIWDRRYPVIDVERGVAMSIVRFGLKQGADPEALGNRPDRLVAEFFAVQRGHISEIQAVLINRPDSEPTGW